MNLLNPEPYNPGSLTALIGENYFIFLFSNRLAMVMESNSL